MPADSSHDPPRHPRPGGGPVYNNADSFAQAFDEAWLQQQRDPQEGGLPAAERIDRVLALVGDHPFLVENAALARQVAEFRIRLLGL